MTGLSNSFDLVFWRVTCAGALRLATPVVFAAIGEMVAERAGTLNLSIDAIMTAGALAAVIGASRFGWPGGLACAALTGAALGLAMAALTLKGRVNQIVAGIALSLVVYGLADFAFQLWQPSGQSAPLIAPPPALRIPGLSALPFVGDVLFNQSALTYACVALTLAVMLALRYTRIGLVLRAAGDDRAAATLRGVAVSRVRTLALAFGGAAAGLGGAAITVGVLGSFTDGVTAGRGYVAIAVVIVGRWTPLGAALGALMFALFESFSLRVQGRVSGWPGEAFAMLPYVVTLLVLVATARSDLAPRELGRDIED